MKLYPWILLIEEGRDDRWLNFTSQLTDKDVQKDNREKLRKFFPDISDEQMDEIEKSILDRLTESVRQELADLMRSLHLLKAKSQQGFLFDSWPILRR
jgi:oligoendopeptidase F